MYKILEEFIILIESKYSKKIIVAIYTKYRFMLHNLHEIIL